MNNNDGLWVVEFRSDYDFGYGVLVFNGTQVMGGDAGYYYFGQVDTTGNISGEVNVVRHNPHANSVFGDVDKFKLFLTGGKICENNFETTATVEKFEHLSIKIKGRKKVDSNEAN